MNCIRCAKETENNQPFCPECQADMERHPVAPGTPIQLPVKVERDTQKRAKFKLAISKWENQVYGLKAWIMWLLVVIAILTLCLTVAICMMAGLTPQWFNDIWGYAAP